MTQVGLELNAGRVRAVAGPLGDYPLPLPLCSPTRELSLRMNLEGPTVRFGPPAAGLARRAPHLLCSDYLPALNDAKPQRWRHGRHDLDAAGALRLMWRHLQPRLQGHQGLVTTLPAYLDHARADQVRGLADKEKVRLQGTVALPLAAAVAGYAEQPWTGQAVVIEADEHALTLGIVQAVEGRAHFLRHGVRTDLGTRHWQERLLDALAETCILQSRRDPRDSAQAEQELFDQIEAVQEGCRQGRIVQLGVQSSHWFQNLVVSPEETLRWCRPLLERTLQQVRSLYPAGIHGVDRAGGNGAFDGSPGDWPTQIVLTAEAARLPGLAAALEGWLHGQALPGLDGADEEDFGENLLRDSGEDRSGVIVLGADAPARAAHALAAHFTRGDLPAGHLGECAPLPLPQPAESGPARLHYHGEEFFLDGARFSLGTQLGCHLVLDGRRHPSVAPRHCEIVFDHRTFLLFNRSKEGTLVNEQAVGGNVVLHPGDRIRLGAGGPVVRFLGRTPQGRM